LGHLIECLVALPALNGSVSPSALEGDCRLAAHAIEALSRGIEIEAWKEVGG